MKKIALLFILTACFAGAVFAQKKPGPNAAAVAAAKEEAATKAAILKLEDANNTAVVKGDWKTLTELYADDFTGINASGGTSVKKDMVSFYTGSESVMAVHSTDETNVRVLGTTAVVTARLKYQYNERMQDPSVKWMRYTRVYTLRDAKWLIVAEHYCFMPAPAKR